MRELSCAQARLLLGASRRDDWTADELAALGAHLEGCAECRRVDASFREVGEHVRQLSSTPTPVGYKARVFAAIAADQARLREQRTGQRAGQNRPAAAIPGVARVAGADTDPGMRVVHPAPIPFPRRALTAAQRNVRLTASVAAMLLVAVMVATLVPASPFYIGGAAPTVSHYTADATYSHIHGASASSTWLAYAGQDASGGAMLLAQDRSGGAAKTLLNAPTSSPLTVYAVTGRWVIWSVGDSNSWTLRATALPVGNASPAARTLLESKDGWDAPAALHGVWASGDRVLAAYATHGGAGQLLQFELAGNAPTSKVIARAATPGHLLTDPSLDGDVYYWADVWQDNMSGLHSSLWRGDSAGHARQAVQSDRAFHPKATRGTLLWVEAAPATAKAASTDLSKSLDQVTGSVQARDLGSGSQQQAGTKASAGSLQAAGGTAIWKDGARTHAYDAAAHGASRADGLLGNAAAANVSDTALTWAQADSPTINVVNLK